MKKIVLSRLFLYRYRFYIGYILLGLVFAGLMFLMPFVSPGGLSREEMASAVESNNLQFSSLLSGDIVSAPFRALQKLSIIIFGLSTYSVKLPAIIIGVATGVLLVLLLNRWFKTNVAMIASGFVAMSAFFLGEAGVGTPAIMVIFWTVLVVWLGAKLVGSRQTDMAVLVTFAVALALSCYSPLFIYLVVFVGVVAVFQPHLRFFLKNYKQPQLIIAFIIFGLLLLPLIFGAVVNSGTLQTILAGGAGGEYVSNVEGAFAPFFFFSVSNVSGVLAPFFGLPTVALMVVGLIASMGKLGSAKNIVIGALVFFAIVASGFYPVMATVMFVPILLLVASGIELTINKWYALFPENPYARLFGVFPIALFSGIAMVSGAAHFFYGYRYVALVAEEFCDDIALVQEYLPTGGLLLVGGQELDFQFYKILERSGMVTVRQDLPDRTSDVVVTIADWQGEVGMPLSQIITSQKSLDSDRLYLYKKEN